MKEWEKIYPDYTGKPSNQQEKEQRLTKWEKDMNINF